MAFDPARPHDHATIEADELRDQFNGLRTEYTALIDAIPDGPPGPPGPQGEPGPPFAAAVVDAVFTIPFGDPAGVTSTFDGSAVHFTFHLPAGQPGAQGEPGTAGEISAAQLADALATTAQNPASFPPFAGTFSDPPTQAEMLAYVAYGEALRQALAR